jgi:hypothetical protein
MGKLPNVSFGYLNDKKGSALLIMESGVYAAGLRKAP